MGEVYLAHDTSLRRSVAVKLLPAQLADSTDSIGRIEREACAASSLNHPNILSASAHIYLGAEYAHSGDRARAQAILKRLQSNRSYVSPGELAILYAALGQREQAFSGYRPGVRRSAPGFAAGGIDSASRAALERARICAWTLAHPSRNQTAIATT
jgi:hypothetical protein